MSRTYKHTRMRRLKTAIVRRKAELGAPASSGMSLTKGDSADNELFGAWRQFFSKFSSMRHGNKRHSVAKDKVYDRRRRRHGKYRDEQDN